MQHSVATIARYRYLDNEIAQRVATTSRNVFKIGADFYSSTGQVDALIAEIKAAQGSDEDNEMIRHREIARQRAEYAENRIYDYR